MRIALLVLLALALPVAVSAQTAPETIDVRAYQRRAAAIFDPTALAAANSDFTTACEHLLVVAQGISVTLIVAGMIMRMQRAHEQMEGVASMMLKVAFIATVPFWQTFVLETTDAMANAVGYHSAIQTTVSSPAMDRLWDLAWQWLPPSTPQLDALAAQNGTDLPASGDELNWSMRAWNWARGVGDASGSMFHSLWQTTSGGFRAALLLLGTAVVSTAVLIALTLTYFAEMLRYFLFTAGCATLPVLIAGLGITPLRSIALRGILLLLSIACWPIGWAFANGVTAPVAAATLSWMSSITAAALGVPSGTAGLPPLAVSAPHIAWSALFVFGAITLVICLWVLGVLVIAPLLIVKGVAAGGQIVTHWSSAPAPHYSAAAVNSRSSGTPSASPVRVLLPLLPPATTERQEVSIPRAVAPIPTTVLGIHGKT